MQTVKANVFSTPIRVIRNTSAGSKNDQWAKIVEARSGKTLHVGQVRYIKRVARKRYNVNASL